MGRRGNLQALGRELLPPAALGLLLALGAFLLPLALPAGGAEGEVLPPSPRPVEAAPGGEEAGPDSQVLLRVEVGEGEVVEMALDEYLYGVLAAEMPASFEVEALRAQAAAARTYTLWKAAHRGEAHPEADVCTGFSCCQAYAAPEEAAAAWGDRAAEYGEKLRQAVAHTSGMVVLWQGELIQAVFHASSAGRTRDASEVWGAAVPYLTAVDSPEGEEVPNYVTTAVFTPEELRQALAGEAPGADFSGDPASWLGEPELDGGGSVSSLPVGGAAISGTRLRALLGLRSAAFTVEYGAGVFTFTVTGHGHGVGLSQYGANAMAAAGYTWQEILTHYYTGTQVGPWPEA